MDAADRLRGILERESATRLAMKRTRVALFLEFVREGGKASQAWSVVADHPDVQQLEDAYERAHIDLVVENAVNWGKLGVTSDELEESH